MPTRGMSLQNPCNIMHNPNFTWNGEVVPTSDPQGRLCQFDSILDGIRAGAKNILAAYRLHGCDTMTKLITRLSPPNENDTAAYIKFMCQECGVDPDAVIDFTDPSLLRVTCRSIIRQEQGYWAGVGYDVLAQGVDEALAG